MIENQTQYESSQLWASKFRKAIAGASELYTRYPTIIRKAQIDAMKSMLEDLEREILEYEALYHDSPNTHLHPGR